LTLKHWEYVKYETESPSTLDKSREDNYDFIQSSNIETIQSSRHLRFSVLIQKASHLRPMNDNITGDFPGLKQYSSCNLGISLKGAPV
jgi:hypothetical protein